MPYNLWPEEDIKTLVDMWQKGFKQSEIAETLGRDVTVVKGYIRRNRKKLNLDYRGKNFKHEGAVPVEDSDFEKLWKGPISRGHWLITKPWGAR